MTDDICLLLDEACFAAAASAKAEGREATDADYRAALEAAWERWLSLQEARDMARFTCGHLLYGLSENLTLSQRISKLENDRRKP